MQKKTINKSDKEEIKNTVKDSVGIAKIERAAKSVEAAFEKTAKKQVVEYDYGKTISTGSTLLDLCISGENTRYGGIPGGVIVEIFGPSSSGKSSVLAEIGASTQVQGGEVAFKDPEARMDARYCKTYGLDINPKTYSKPDTVTEVFAELGAWKPEMGKINTMCVDSLAALSTDLELEKGDKMGMRRAKEFSEGFRIHCRRVERNKWLFACSNQIRQGDYGETTPGGNAAGFYASLRIRIKMKEKMEKEKTFRSGVKKKGYIGIISECFIAKSTVGKPYRSCPLYITFGIGIDDIKANLQYIKDNLKLTTYKAVDKEYQQLDAAVKYIEENNLEDTLREEVVDLWNEIENLFSQERKPKKRR